MVIEDSCDAGSAETSTTFPRSSRYLSRPPAILCIDLLQEDAGKVRVCAQNGIKPDNVLGFHAIAFIGEQSSAHSWKLPLRHRKKTCEYGIKKNITNNDDTNNDDNDNNSNENNSHLY